jgi:hypothetical protein
LRRGPLLLNLKKLMKLALTWPPLYLILFSVVGVVERGWPDGKLLGRLYRLVLGVHIQRGYRSGLRSLPLSPD